VTAPAARPARQADHDRLAVLGKEARAEFAGQRGGLLFNVREGPDVPVGETAGAGPEGDACLWVGTLDEVVVGYAAARVDDLRDGSRLGVISHLYVEPGARAVGVGECLVRVAVDWCASRDCVGVDAAALPGGRAAKNFFEESGFTARLLVMHRPLERDGDG
jgi:GNAT superfamily N-acetyltransferase